MSRDRIAQAATAAVLVTALVIAVARRTSQGSSEADVSRPAPQAQAEAAQEPQDVIYTMLAAARAGDVKAYLASYTGQMEAALRRTVEEETEPGFAKYLRDSQAPIKGVAVAEPQKVTEREAKVRVEYTYQDRSEAQTMYLEKNRNGWKISRADSGELIPTLIPYGTPLKEVIKAGRR